MSHGAKPAWMVGHTVHPAVSFLPGPILVLFDGREEACTLMLPFPSVSSLAAVT